MLVPEGYLKEYPTLLRQILWTRGFQNEEDARAFLNPSLSQIPSPTGSLLDLDLAIKLCIQAKEKQDQVIIFGDYDVDGTTSTVLLYSALNAWGFKCGSFIPHRVQDGYGVTVKGAQKLLQEFPEVKLVITCDCGIASFEGIQFLKSHGIKVIVTDHHEVPPDRVAADAVLNPKQKKCSYPDKKMAGVGVAFLLLIGLRRALDLKEVQLSSYLDLVAVGTVCDVAELVGVNRALVRMGLKRLEQTDNKGLREILRRNSLEDSRLKTRDLGFVIGPRLNAAGRIGDATLGVKTLLASTEAEAIKWVSQLEEHNRQRREIQDLQVKEAQITAEKEIRCNPTRQSLVIANSEFHLGIVGLVASRLAETYKRPVCVLTELKDEHALADFSGQEGLWKGSLRAPAGSHLAASLQRIREKNSKLLVSGGGHALAAGVAIDRNNLDLFVKEFEQATVEQGRTEVTVEVDAVLNNSDRIDEVLGFLEPIGNGNPAPLLRVNSAQLQKVNVMKEIHLRLQTQIGGQNWSVLQFKSPWVRLFQDLKVSQGVLIDFLAELSENEWNGNKRVELILRDLLDMKVSGKKFEIQRHTSENATGASQSV